MIRDGKLDHVGPRPMQRRELIPSAAIEVSAVESAMYSPLRAYWDILIKRRWTILTAVFVVFTLVTIFSFKMRPVYKATARVEIDAETPQLQSINDLYQNPLSDETFLETQVRVLESDNLVWQTIEQLKLAGNPAFAPRSLPATRGTPEASGTEEALVREFRKHLSVALALNTRMVEVSFESTDPDLAARVVNTLVKGYVEYNFRMKYDATRQASGWMEQQLDELKAKVEKSQQALVDYERQHAIVNVSDKQNVVEEKLEDLSRDLTSAQNDLSQKQSLYGLVQSNKAQIATLAQNELLQRLEEKFADLRSQYVDALGQYGPNFPKVIRLSDQVSEMQALIDQERERTVQRIGSDYTAALGRVRLLADSVGREKVQVGDLNQLLIQHNILKRDFDTNQQLYDSLLQHLKDATVSAGLRATNIHVIDTARPPTIPVRPQKALNLSLGFMVGLLLGVVLAFVREGLDDSIKSAEDVERLIGVSSLAVIPAAGSVRAGAYGTPAKQNGSKASRNGTVALTVLKDSGSALAEAYRSLRTSVLFSTAPRPPQTILVASAQPNEGKTCTSLNLALTLAQRGGRVLIIDSDMRKPSVARTLGLSNEKGLSGILAGAHIPDDALQQVEGAPNLWVLAAGPRSPNPVELLGSPAMEDLLSELRQRFDHVVFDSPPVLMVTDATVLSTLADGVVLVVEGGVTARGALVRAHRILVQAGARVLGVVVNKVQTQRGYYYGPYSYGVSSNGRDHDSASEARAVATAASASHRG
ncbi:MAG TPA: polysaccharide biosynthesis tyrosine autokinase [Terriglobia bacterium]|nr:polysaccharide biosynthesis tyrosine autokinase [Terriglobia bacterium]